MAKRGKKIVNAYKQVDKTRQYDIAEAIALVKSSSFTKFDETIDVAFNLSIDPKHADQMVRGVCSLPNGTGKKVRVAVFAKEAKAEEAKQAGADLVGAEDLVEQVKAGKIDFDRCIATPDMMALVGRVAKILGPKGLMPNPKVGTVTMDVASAISDIKSGMVEFRAEKAGIVHAIIGKCSFEEDKLVENYKELRNVIDKSRPSGAKGQFIESIHISSSMGASISLSF